jgi:hypothetical protein
MILPNLPEESQEDSQREGVDNEDGVADEVAQIRRAQTAMP